MIPTLRVSIYGVDRMVTKTDNGKIKKLSRGMRRHLRRIKQESRKEVISEDELKRRLRSLRRIHKEEAGLQRN